MRNVRERVERRFRRLSLAVVLEQVGQPLDRALVSHEPRGPDSRDRERRIGIVHRGDDGVSDGRVHRRVAGRALENPRDHAEACVADRWVRRPKHRDQLYNEMCRTQLDYDRGDDFLQIGRFNITAARNYLLRSVPRRSLPALLYRVAFLFLGSALVPVLHWFTPSKPMGDLRPWRA